VSYANASTGSGSLRNDTSHPWYIGARGNLNSAYFFQGSIDDLRIYDRVLTPSEILQRFNSY
ncbi:MAG: LamG-like jellyroll fold domain-containing protein, partial [Planctomycetota bacterium]